MRIPSMDEIWEVSESRGANSEAPHLWEGLVGAWPLQEGGGSTVWDVSGNGNNGTPVGTNLLSNRKLGQFGRVVGTDGIDDYIQIPINSYVSKPFSVLVWLSATLKPNAWQSVMGVKTHDTNGQNAYYLHVARNDGDKQYGFEWCGNVNSLGDVVRGPSTFPSGYHMLGGMVAYESVSVILDGRIRASVTRTRTFPSPPSYFTTIGAAVFNNNILDFTQCDCFLAQIYGRPLLPREWAKLYADPWAMYRVRPRVLVRGVTLKKTPIHHLMAGCT